jgi:hypothetical protein
MLTANLANCLLEIGDCDAGETPQIAGARPQS